jgi:hypothetical protein
MGDRDVVAVLSYSARGERRTDAIAERQSVRLRSSDPRDRFMCRRKKGIHP